MHRRPTVDPRLLFRYSSSCSFTASAMTNVCCRKVASMVSTSESSESDESDSKNFSHGVNSIYTHTGASIYYTARKNHKKGTNRWRVIPGGDEGVRSTVVDPQRRRRGAALLAGSGGAVQRLGAGGCGAAPRSDSARRYGRNRRRRAGESKGGPRRKEGEKSVELKCPSRQLLLCDAGHRSREGETRVFPGWGRKFAAPPKIFCGPGRDARSGRAGFPARTRILAVILRVGGGCGVC